MCIGYTAAGTLFEYAVDIIHCHENEFTDVTSLHLARIVADRLPNHPKKQTRHYKTSSAVRPTRRKDNPPPERDGSETSFLPALQSQEIRSTIDERGNYSTHAVREFPQLSKVRNLRDSLYALNKLVEM